MMVRGWLDFQRAVLLSVLIGDACWTHGVIEDEIESVRLDLSLEDAEWSKFRCSFDDRSILELS